VLFLESFIPGGEVGDVADGDLEALAVSLLGLGQSQQLHDLWLPANIAVMQWPVYVAGFIVEVSGR
jgi:hypothetical protein